MRPDAAARPVIRRGLICTEDRHFSRIIRTIDDVPLADDFVA
jgi:hypothetical protein